MVKESTAMSAIKGSFRGSMRTKARFTARHAEPSKSPSPLDHRNIEDIWRDFAKTRDEPTRNYLMERFLPLVRYNAERIYARLPDEVDIEDLMSAGVFGLMDAIDAFDLDRKVKFETYCAPRIRGAILDELRSMDWVPRLVRHRAGKVEQARQHIEKTTGVAATDDQIASHLKVNQEEFDKLKRDSAAVLTRSLTQRAYPGDGTREARDLDVVREDAQFNPINEIQRRDMRELITKGLSRAERLIVILYYYEAMTMKEIGATLDLSESRVSQMHSSILARLKAQMQHRTRDLEEVD